MIAAKKPTEAQLEPLHAATCDMEKALQQKVGGFRLEYEHIEAGAEFYLKSGLSAGVTARIDLRKLNTIWLHQPESISNRIKNDKFNAISREGGKSDKG